MYAVIMAGGSGTRFWPVSRELRPKQFLKIIGDTPMVVATYERIQSILPDDHIVLVIGEQHKRETERLFAGRGVRILEEPMGRNTAPCIGLAAKYIEYLGGGNEPIIVLPADHYIADSDTFRTSLLQAAKIATAGAIVTLGIIPTRPESGYGYIRRQSPSAEESIYRVGEFVEKPDLLAAQKFLLSGDYYWNAGIFIATPVTLLEEFKRQMPDLWEGLDQVSACFDTQDFKSALGLLYERTEGISFDYGIMEKTSKPVYVIPCDCGWSDVGSWHSLYEVRIGDEQDNFGNVVEGDVLVVDCSNSFLLSRGKRVLAALGLKKLLVVDTDDALLVADLERSQEVKSIINRLKDNGYPHML